MNDQLRMQEREELLGQIRTESEKLGQRAFKSRVEAAARASLAQFPTRSEYVHLDRMTVRYVERIQRFLELSLRASTWTDGDLEVAATELAWSRLASDIIALALKNNGSGTGAGSVTCATGCRQEYDKCINAENCDEDAWLCLCCLPCAAQYTGCIAKCVVGSGGFGNWGGGVIV